tara:strand:- start:591 stop:821 length:231 start_codon:yes stop_codon:yes gene_type:complete
MKVLRVTFHRLVKQKAISDFQLSDDEHKKIKNGEIQPEEIVKNKIGEDYSYSSVGWIETSAEPPNLDYKIGSWTTD